MLLRRPAVAGTFYPSGATALRRTVDALLCAATGPGGRTRALIAPHAGLVFSGPVAATAYRAIAGDASITRVVLIGPSHHVAFGGIAAPAATAFVTPLGEIPVDLDALRRVLPLPQVEMLDEAHRFEHSLELQLPFLQVALGPFSIVPLVVGHADSDAVADVLDALWDDDGTLVVVSSDLSHYHGYEEAVAIDAGTAGDIVGQRPVLTAERACGATGVNALLRVTARRHLNVRELDRRNSGDTAGPRDRVVGYGAYAVGP